MKTINIIFCSDQDYYKQLCVAINSLLSNCSKTSVIYITIFDGGINMDSKKNIKKMVSSYGSRVRFIKKNLKKYDHFKLWGQHVNKTTYYRLEIPSLFKKEKVIYLDSDMIILGDILEIYRTDLNSKCVGAVLDYFLGLVGKRNYFNAGFMIIDCNRWNKMNYTKKFLNYYNKNFKQITLADQDVLNGILYNDWIELPLEWNRQRIIFELWPQKSNLEKNVFNNLLLYPKIIHFTGKVKPWHYRYIFPDKKIYNYYLLKLGFNKEYADVSVINFFYRPLRWMVYKTKLRSIIDGF
jgi:lipopolysaccharide biosynthesis glycosyltransferase